MEHDKVFLRRFIENELRQTDFLSCKDYKHISYETLFFVYVAGHGCADTHQILVLNEDDHAKAFWSIEKQLLNLAKMCGSSLKILVVYDVCREPKSTTEQSMIKGREAKGLPAAGQTQSSVVDDQK